MNPIETSAVALIAFGAKNAATTERGRAYADDEGALAAVTLATEMAHAIQDNPEGFLAWFRGLPTEEEN